MDKIACCVLDKICSLTALGRYVVVSADELYECFPEEADICETELKKAVKTLAAEGYIDLKYQGGEMFCAAPLRKYVPEPETAQPLQTEKVITEKKRKPDGKLLMFLAAFAGGAAGSLLISLIFALV